MERSKRDVSVIKHILAYCDEIEQTVTRFGNSYDSFVSDKIYRNASTMCILQIGELAGRLSPEFVASHQTIPWRSIRGMRNVAAHTYGNISIPDVWDTIISDIPMLKEYCTNIVW